MSKFIRTLPSNNQTLRESLYAGDIYLASANEASFHFVKEVSVLIENELGGDYRSAHETYSDDAFFEKIGRLRKQIYTSLPFHSLVNHVISSLGFDLNSQAYDPARIRVVSHNGHLTPAAAPVYYGHRDTWYSNPQAMITWWVPLHDVRAEDSFRFYPDYFSRVVQNDSEIFDFDAWTSKDQKKRIGWQNKDTGKTAQYPSLQQGVSGNSVPVIAKAGEILLFSGQHLHQTQQNSTGETRFSLDFRTVDLNDSKNGIGAINVDNRSTGSSLVQFIRPINSTTVNSSKQDLSDADAS
ncbi:MAG: hypothetical protein AB8B55_11440 [Mariniblastus sp.]